jgi:hypothetical protein
MYNVAINKQQISKIFGISDVTISKTYRKIDRHHKIIMDNRVVELILEKKNNIVKKPIIFNESNLVISKSSKMSSSENDSDYEYESESESDEYDTNSDYTMTDDFTESENSELIKLNKPDNQKLYNILTDTKPKKNDIKFKDTYFEDSDNEDPISMNELLKVYDDSKKYCENIKPNIEETDSINKTETTYKTDSTYKTETTYKTDSTDKIDTFDTTDKIETIYKTDSICKTETTDTDTTDKNNKQEIKKLVKSIKKNKVDKLEKIVKPKKEKTTVFDKIVLPHIPVKSYDSDNDDNLIRKKMNNQRKQKN